MNTTSGLPTSVDATLDLLNSRGYFAERSLATVVYLSLRMLPGLAPKVIEKTLRVTAERLAPAGAKIVVERRVPHDEDALAAAIKEVLALDVEMVIVFGASAIADRRDVIPAAIVSNGGTVDHFGMAGLATGRPRDKK